MACKICSVFHSAVYAPYHIFGYRYGFFLGLCAGYRKQHLVWHICRIYIFFLKQYAHAVFFKQSCVHNRIDRVSCKSANRFSKYTVDLSVFAVIYKPAKIISIFCLCSAYPLVCVYIHKLHTLIVPDKPGIVSYLCRERMKLIGGIAWNSAIGCRSYLSLLGRCGVYSRHGSFHRFSLSFPTQYIPHRFE